MKKSARQSGQALIIILLVMAVGLTIGLSIVSRSITDIRISQQEEESARAFSAAEAGIEQVLIGGEKDFSVGGVDVQVTETAQGGGTAFNFNNNQFEEGDVRTVWLVEHDTDGNLDPSVKYEGSYIEVYWGNEGQAAGEDETPALEATIIYEESGYKVARHTFDPNAGRRGANKFGTPESGGPHGLTVDGQTFNFQFKGRIEPLPSGTLYALRLRLHYNGTQAHALGVEGNGTFPSQGKCYQSTATVPETGITRKVQQCQSHKAPPGIFDYVLFSGGSLTK